MFKKIFNLTYNELVKQFKKVSINVIIALVLVSAILLPIGMNIVNSKFNINSNTSGNEMQLKQVENMYEESKSTKTEEGKIKTAILEVEKEYWELRTKNKVDYNEWRQLELQEYQSVAVQIFGLNQVLNGVNEKVLLDNIYNVNIDELKEAYDLPKDKVKEKIEALTKENEERKNIVNNNDYLKYLNNHIKRQEKFIEEDKKSIIELEKTLKQDSKNEQVKEQLEHDNRSIVFSENILKLDKYRFDNKIDFSSSNWKNNTLQNIKECMENLRYPMLTEKQFNSGHKDPNMRMSYEEYKKEYENKTIELKETIERDWYSLNNNLPQLHFIKDARNMVSSTYDIYVILAVVIIIIVGGGIVASEFASGTIRLLMIRPVSRGKILLSKLLAVLIIGLGVVIASILLLVISSGFVFGFDTLQTSIIQSIGGKIVEVSYIKYLLTNVAISCAGLIFITCLVFMISTLARNTALAVAISMLLYLGSMPITMLLANIRMTWIADTLIPYINQSMINLSPFVVEALKSQSGIRLNPSFGALQLIIASAIMLGITFITFIKRDIKN